ncbi:hypothetical protein PPGU19_094040 (plasmid) [Paraburkholderia sp. PGU19]|uniref:hypothetical protein n=1 Tax=Paraburkholderia sp. PGU19 TaxID=2735434 RepID=UPI0015DB9316|nr:hypothetical protein [Paraburkholderia sp. PGU19]BCG04836.1 hypothetical protein PPGU19_094040 [Paraburkholderia sp. PGU19]
MNRLPDAAAPIEICRAELAEPIRLAELVEDWRRDLNALESRVIRRDRDALHRIEAALTQSGDVYAFTSALQCTMQAYANETFSIWGDAALNAAQHQAGLIDELTHLSSAWRLFWFAPLQKLPGADAPFGSFSAWLRACQDEMLSVVRSSVVQSRAPANRATAGA